MLLVPLSAVPSQTLQIVLGGQNCALSIYVKDGYDYSDPTLETPSTNLYFDLNYTDVNGNIIQVTNTAICLNEKRLLINRQYLGFVGDFMFIDTQGSDDPQYTGLGARWEFVYIEAGDL